MDPDAKPLTAAGAPSAKVESHRKNAGLSGIVQLTLVAIIAAVGGAVYLMFWH